MLAESSKEAQKVSKIEKKWDCYLKKVKFDTFLKVLSLDNKLNNDYFFIIV